MTNDTSYHGNYTFQLSGQISIGQKTFGTVESSTFVLYINKCNLNVYTPYAPDPSTIYYEIGEGVLNYTFQQWG